MNKNSSENKNFDGVQSVAEMLNLLDAPNRDRLLSSIEARDPSMASQIRQKMFVFEDLVKFDSLGMQFLLKEVPQSKLVLSLKTASEDLKKVFYSQMSQRTANLVREELSLLGPQRLSSVISAQQEIVKTAQKLVAEGKLTLRK